ncbi:unnamed protein product [Lota lota]
MKLTSRWAPPCCTHLNGAQKMLRPRMVFRGRPGPGYDIGSSPAPSGRRASIEEAKPVGGRAKERRVAAPVMACRLNEDAWICSAPERRRRDPYSRGSRRPPRLLASSPPRLLATAPSSAIASPPGQLAMAVYPTVTGGPLIYYYGPPLRHRALCHSHCCSGPLGLLILAPAVRRQLTVVTLCVQMFPSPLFCRGGATVEMPQTERQAAVGFSSLMLCCNPVGLYIPRSFPSYKRLMEGKERGRRLLHALLCSCCR